MAVYQQSPNYYTYPQYQYQPTTPAQQVNQGLLWVSGEVGAKSYLVAPNSTVLLMDSDAEKFYLKSADNAGMPNLRIFEYHEITNAPQQLPHSTVLDEKTLNDKYVTRSEYDGLKRMYDRILERLDGLHVDGVDEPVAKPKSRGRGGSGNEQSNI